jgi:hypothetical protein
VAPFVAAPEIWKKQQISKFDPAKVLFVRLDRAARGEPLSALLP